LHGNAGCGTSLEDIKLGCDLGANVRGFISEMEECSLAPEGYNTEIFLGLEQKREARLSTHGQLGLIEITRGDQWQLPVISCSLVFGVST
jgi:hypothetical protein